MANSGDNDKYSLFEICITTLEKRNFQAPFSSITLARMKTKNFIFFVVITAVILDISTYFVTISCPSHEKNTTFRLLRDQKEQKTRIYQEFPSDEDKSSSQKINVFKPGGENSIKVKPVTPDNQNKPVVDFHIAGFPKCGTTSLLYAFNNHNETSISDREYCNIDSGSKSDEQVIFALQDSMKNLSISSDIKVGIKCPLSVFHIRGIKILSENSPNTKIIIGVRHPVLFFQSFYNYRVTEMHNNGLKEEVPPPETLLGNKHWKRVSTDLARYELSLMQFGKAKLTAKDMSELSQRKMIQAETKNKIFLYSIEQLESEDKVISSLFRDDMQKFLGLSIPIEPFPRENVGWGKVKKFTEHIDICEEKYYLLRRLLLSQGKETRRWIRDEFIISDDVIVGGKDHFIQLMESWDEDPCLERASK